MVALLPLYTHKIINIQNSILLVTVNAHQINYLILLVELLEHTSLQQTICC